MVHVVYLCYDVCNDVCACIICSIKVVIYGFVAIYYHM